jgi:hypothetical protein
MLPPSHKATEVEKCCGGQVLTNKIINKITPAPRAGFFDTIIIDKMNFHFVIPDNI